MKRFTDAGRAAIKCDNLYVALTLALIIPDICGSLEDPGPGKSQKRYEAWFEKWAQPKFAGNKSDITFISAHDCYQIRCSVIHSGTSEIDPKKRDILSEFVFMGSKAPHLTWVEGCVSNGMVIPNFLQLNTARFSEDMFTSADEWDLATASDETIKWEKAKLLKIHMDEFSVGGFVIS